MDDARPALAALNDEQVAVSREAADRLSEAVTTAIPDLSGQAEPVNEMTGYEPSPDDDDELLPPYDENGKPYFQVIAPADIREYTVLREPGESDEAYAERVALNDLILTAGGY